MGTKEIAQKYLDVYHVGGGKRPDADLLTSGLYSYSDDAQVMPFVRYLASKVVKLSEQGKDVQAERTLGFLQGILWASGEFSLREIGDHIKDPNNIANGIVEDDEDLRFD